MWVQPLTWRETVEVGVVTKLRLVQKLKIWKVMVTLVPRS